MSKKIFSAVVGMMVVCFVGVAVYADNNGLFLQDNDAAMRLVDKYVSLVMKNYMPDGSDVSFRGIIKQGCDFWYYNDYDNKNIALSHSSGSGKEVTDTDYSIVYNSIEYKNRKYVIDATITEYITYKEEKTPTSVVKNHVITIEQDGRDMLIVNDEEKPNDGLPTSGENEQTFDSPDGL